jgi:hypothetical protein
MPSTIWTIGAIRFSLPPEFSLVSNQSGTEFTPWHEQVTEEFRSWETPDGKALHAFYWVPVAPRPGGPMVVANSYPAVVAGKDMTISETSMFMGKSQRVLVLHLDLSGAGSRALIYSEGMLLQEFRSLLSQVTIPERAFAVPLDFIPPPPSFFPE